MVMLRHCQVLVLLTAALLAGCGGGSPSPNTGPASQGSDTQGSLSISPPTFDFGNVAVGSSTTQQGHITASSSAVTVSSGSWSGNGYSVSGITFPVTLPAGQSANFSVTFAPQGTGSVSGGISFVSNAKNSPIAGAFAGVGAGNQGVPHVVSLTWGPSPSTVIGYNVYRGTTSGGPYATKLTSSPQAATTLVDNTVLSGTTYYYVATSVDQNSIESVYSNQLVAAVP